MELTKDDVEGLLLVLKKAEEVLCFCRTDLKMNLYGALSILHAEQDLIEAQAILARGLQETHVTPVRRGEA